MYVMTASPEFFSTMEIPLLLGRGFSDRDVATSQKVAVINEAAARSLFPGESPLGRHIGFSPEESGNMAFVARTLGDPNAMSESVRAAVRDVDPNLPIAGITTQADQLEQRFAQERLFAMAYSLFGGLALVLACIGLFGLMSYSVARRTNEIGIRMALGASRQTVVRMVLTESLVLVGIGIAIGLGSAAAAGRLVSVVLFGLVSGDALTIISAVVLVLLVSVLAGYLPARRASRVDPMVALHQQ